ncbi:hypothetical protein J4460_07925 [Candidatus Woesearchaeota archaeon]|nr:hypothetical protein [Candidatus Woesearchaeota archaeon]HIH38331.1 hypothetical protein [Candidatus Woesearchaeota archaeon]HIH48239.1 hypothetical protein [Candidatus Woesearchaeota archaeon]HIJ03277.1 hypothetical protein [Candidatus Woesearchaeota archaeon]
MRQTEQDSESLRVASISQESGIPFEIVQRAMTLGEGESFSAYNGNPSTRRPTWSARNNDGQLEIWEGPVGGLGREPTYAERNQAESSGCFVATAVYQNPHAPEVDLYRWFRDAYLQHHTCGRKLVNAYYGGLGERLAGIVEEHPFLRGPCRGTLDFGARVLGYLHRKSRATE